MSSTRTAAALAALALSLAAPAHAYPHVVAPGETLAKIAEKSYGLVELERVLVAANGLDAGGGISIVTGMRLEVPALGHHRVDDGDTWATLARTLLGHESRAEVLASANDTASWIAPASGTEIVVPYNLRVVVGPADSLISISQRFLGSKEKAWLLDRYNFLGTKQPRKGDIVLVPLSNLRLTEEGKAEAASAAALERSQAGGSAREAQRRVEAEIPALLAEVRSGRYVDAAVRGTRLLGYGALSKVQTATIQRQLLEAFVALDARGHAAAACRAWHEADPSAQVDPTYVSPKIVAACDAAFYPPAAQSAPPVKVKK